MATNEMCNSGNSPELSKKLNNSETPNLQAKLSFLEQCGVDKKYLEMFAKVSCKTTDDLCNVLGDNPSQEEVGVANSYLDLAFLQVSQYHSARVRGVVTAAANDDQFGLAA